MKKILFVLLISSLLTICTHAQTSNTGVGVLFGEPTGISAKFWVSDNEAFAGGLGWHFIGPNDGINLHLDYLYHIDNSFQTNIRFPLYYGFGVRIREVASEFGLGFRGVGGLLYYLDPEPIDIFFELAPVFRLLPNTNLDVDIAVGARYYFK